MDGQDRPVIKAYGFIEALTYPDPKENNLGRVNLVLDSMRVEAFRPDVRLEDAADDLLIVRILSTIKRLEARFPESIWEEGSWIEFELQDSPGDPPAWYLSAGDDYSGRVVRTNITNAIRLGGRPFSANTLEQKLIEFCRYSDTNHVHQTLGKRHRRNALHGPFVRVVDVGQASFSAIHSSKRISSPILGYFDVGEPLFFHHKTFPSVFREQKMVPASGFVVLSHWDFDHYSLAVSKLPQLRNLAWYAPDQSVGPNAARLQALLGTNLTLLSAPFFAVRSGIELWKGTGASSNRNDSGYAMRITRAGGPVLLSGDLPYSMLPVGIGNQFSAIVVTHHGGAFTGPPPAPLTQGGVAAVSYGIPNRYHHPNAPAIGHHQSAGWSIQPTNTSAKKRGDVWL
ncbi:hypothetical protein MRS45_01560 [Pseudomonas viridiflava]|uniref:hypothetical protein n=1 Tax=Pseudomonas viridiflava TaxID=33069 RepID=UPI001FD6D05E|nr:hypothetical protein [Pseudomonas viridiflava]MCJ8174780.1 hypothetical protein [Pseudomonas viridiflava]